MVVHAQHLGRVDPAERQLTACESRQEVKHIPFLESYPQKGEQTHHDFF